MNFKIRVRDMGFTIQEKLFKLGYEWFGSGKVIKWTYFDYIYVKNNKMTCGSFYNEFIQSPLTEITLEELMKMDNTKEKAQERIDAIKKELAELEAIVNKPEKWQDKLVQPTKEEYYYMAGHALEGLTIYSNICSTAKRKPEHAFKIQEQAELVKEKMLLMQEMLAFAHVRNEGKQFDWTDSTDKFGIQMTGGDLEIDNFYRANWFVFGIAVKSREIAEEMLEIFGERIEKYYNVQY